MSEVSEDLVKRSLSYKNDYTIDSDTLTTTLRFASIPSLVILSLMNLTLTSIILYMVLRSYDLGLTAFNHIGLAILISITILITGGLGGFTWQKIGLWIASNTYKIYTNKFDIPFFKYLGTIYLKLAGKNSVIYLEGQALDVNYNNFSERITFVIGIGIAQLSFFLLYITYVWNPLFNQIKFFNDFLPDYTLEIQAILSIACSIGTLALYLPATFILRDSNLRLWNTKERKIGQPLATLRSLIQSLIGISAILTGWGLYQNLIEDGELLVLGFLFSDGSYSLILMLDYFFALVVIIIVTAPFVYPAAVTYNLAHSRNVNKFRTGAILSGVEVGVSKVRIATREEKENIGDYINENIT